VKQFMCLGHDSYDLGRILVMFSYEQDTGHAYTIGALVEFAAPGS